MSVFRGEMKQITFIVITSIITADLLSALNSRKKKENIPIFSEYLGQMNWYDANATCRSMKMKLPVREDLERAYNAGITRGWNQENFLYWTSEESRAEEAYYFSIFTGNMRDSCCIPKSEVWNVRCIRF